MIRLSRAGNGFDVSLGIRFDTECHGETQSVGCYLSFVINQQQSAGLFGDLRLHPFIKGIFLINGLVYFINSIAAHMLCSFLSESAAQEGRCIKIDRFHAAALFTDLAG